jgi:cytidine deaminase
MSAPLAAVQLTALVAAAREARERAHAPYSGFKVGSAVMTAGGTLYQGCNVENASYGLCCCAERTALFTAVAAGCEPFAGGQPPSPGRITHLSVIADTHGPVSPCGACRQVMIELGGPGLIVIQANLRGELALTTAQALLPGAFVLQGAPR